MRRGGVEQVGRWEGAEDEGAGGGVVVGKRARGRVAVAGERAPLCSGC